MGNKNTIWRGVGEKPVSLHHAYGFSGPREETVAELLRSLGTIWSIDMHGNPDLLVREYDSFTIDDARRVRELALQVPLKDRKIIILAFNTATSDAQNALLKLLEEPAEHTHFFLVVPRIETLLATVRSRLFTVEGEPGASDEARKSALDFLKKTPGERLNMAKKIADEISEGERERTFVVEFIGSVEKALWAHRTKNLPVQAFEDIALCRKYAADRSASVKMLLEHLAVVLPGEK